MRRIFIIVFLVATLVLSACTGATALPYVLAEESTLPEFLHDAPHTVREAYRYAVHNAHELENYPCYCGCGAMGHTSNRDCFIREIDKADNVTFDEHASACGICVDIAQDVMRLLREGETSLEIRTYIDTTYSAFGPSTDTPLPQM